MQKVEVDLSRTTEKENKDIEWSTPIDENRWRI